MWGLDYTEQKQIEDTCKFLDHYYRNFSPGMEQRLGTEFCQSLNYL